MSDSALMQKGFQKLLNPEHEFAEERRFGRKILYVAWAVEILAALTGLGIAWGTAWDAYNLNPDKTSSTLINAVLGALPFLVIATIEPTKIPLAGGLYKTKVLGWKILIFAALLLLTGVTFETMFTGLERNLTNTTAVVTREDNKILKLESELTEVERLLKSLTSKSPTEATQEQTSEINTLREQLIAETNSINEDARKQIAPIEAQIASLQQDLAALTAGDNQNLQTRIDASNRQIQSLEARLQVQLDLKKSSASSSADQANLIRQQISDANKDLTSQLERIKKQRTDDVRALEERRAQRLANVEETILSNKDDLERQEINRQFNTEQEKINKDAENALRSAEASSRAMIDSLQSQLDQIASSTSESIDREIASLRNTLRKAQEDQTRLLESLTGATASESNRIRQKINDLNTQISEIQGVASERIQAKSETNDARIDELNSRKAEIQNEFLNQKNRIPELEQKVSELQESIDDSRSIKREKSQTNQVYRLAAMYYELDDVADVNREQLKNVATVWFGSIALIVSTIGTVLALISYILTDPEAFVVRRKISLARRAQRITYVLSSRLIMVIKSVIDLLKALTAALISIAEVFRGLIGRPLQRSLRQTLVAIRKKMNQPRIVEIEKEVEKIVEVEIEKIVEKEIEVEKIVEKEIPVEKVVIQEVPKEIVRKELVYVPLYSTENGLIQFPQQDLQPPSHSEPSIEPGTKGSVKVEKNNE